MNLDLKENNAQLLTDGTLSMFSLGLYWFNIYKSSAQRNNCHFLRTLGKLLSMWTQTGFSRCPAPGGQAGPWLGVDTR